MAIGMPRAAGVASFAPLPYCSRAVENPAGCAVASGTSAVRWHVRPAAS